MAGESINLEPEMEVIGKHGCYRIKNEIGNGGNGTVFKVDVIKGDPCQIKREIKKRCRFVLAPGERANRQNFPGANNLWFTPHRP